MELDLDFQDKFRHIIQKIEETGDIYADKKSKSWYAQELKGSIFASIIKELPKMPVSQAELTARASDDYKNYLAETKETIREELLAKSQLEKWKSSFEALRSLSSLEKAQINNESH